MHGRKECSSRGEAPPHAACHHGCMGLMYINGMWQCPWRISNTYQYDITSEHLHLFSPREMMLHISNTR